MLIEAFNMWFKTFTYNDWN